MASLIRRGACAGLLALTVAGFLSCREPTQITVSVTTDAACPEDSENRPRLNDIVVLSGRKIGLGSSELIPNAQTQQCTAGDKRNEIGTLVLLPDGGDDPSVEVLIVAGVTRGDSSTDPASSMSAGACASRVNQLASIEGLPCIVARRRLTFVDHNRLSLPIDLDKRCIGEECGVELTCFQGNCVDPEIVCPDGAATCNEPIGCNDECEASCPSGNASCVDGECACLDCDPGECAGNCPIGLSGHCADNVCECFSCEQNEDCDDVCQGSGTCSDGLCICHNCSDDCEALPCGPRTFECLGDQCVCFSEACEDPGCDAACVSLGSGLQGDCDPASQELPGCYCSCDEALCASDCGGVCSDGGEQCICPPACDAQICESAGSCPAAYQTWACDPGCVCDCQDALCNDFCVGMQMPSGQCAPDSEACDCNTGSGGTGGAGGAGGAGGSVSSNGSGGGGGNGGGGGGVSSNGSGGAGGEAGAGGSIVSNGSGGAGGEAAGGGVIGNGSGGGDFTFCPRSAAFVNAVDCQGMCPAYCNGCPPAVCTGTNCDCGGSP